MKNVFDLDTDKAIDVMSILIKRIRGIFDLR